MSASRYFVFPRKREPRATTVASGTLGSLCKLWRANALQGPVIRPRRAGQFRPNSGMNWLVTLFAQTAQLAVGEPSVRSLPSLQTQIAISDSSVFVALRVLLPLLRLYARMLIRKIEGRHHPRMNRPEFSRGI